VTVRISDVAEEAGVSRPTASLILLGKGERYAAETQKRVLAAAEKLNYRPNILADSFREQRSFLVGVLCSGVNYNHNTDLQRAIQSALLERGLAPITFTHTGLEEELACLDACMSRRVDGLIVNAAVDRDGSTNAARLAEIGAGLPTVEIFGRFIAGVPSILFDYRAAGRLAVERLVQEGHRSIALYVHEEYRRGEDGSGLYWTAWEEWQGYTGAMADAGLSPVVVTHSLAEDLTSPGDRYAQALESVERLVHHGSQPTAALCLGPDDAEALMLYTERVRGEMSIVTMGTSAVLSVARDRVHTMVTPVREVGERAVAAVCELGEGRDVPDHALAPSW